MSLRNKILFSITLASMSISAWSANLVEVYQQALMSDPVYQEAIDQTLSSKQNVPVTIAALLPNIGVDANPTVTRQGFAGTNLQVDASTGAPLTPRNNTLRTYTLALNVSQTVFDFAKFSQVKGAVAISKEADATLNSALQNLMIRVSSAYFAVLRDEENLNYSAASKRAFAEQLDQVRQQYNVGLKTLTDVYTAQASYESAVAANIAAKTALQNDRENLRVLTGEYYPTLAQLSDSFPLVTPKPTDVEKWVDKALQENWSIKASQHAVDAARQTIRQQFAGHLPTVNMQGSLNRQYDNNINSYVSLTSRGGAGTVTNRQVTLDISIPLFAGGGVVAKTNQATYDYEASEKRLEQTVRNTTNNTRQYYNSVIAGISQVKADRQAIKSNISSLKGMEASYRIGTTTLVDVLNQQQKLFQAQTQYATDRYAYVNNVLALKQAAGTLSFDDLRAINEWLSNGDNSQQQYIHAVSIKPTKNVSKLKPKKVVAAKKATAKETKHHIAYLTTPNHPSKKA